MALINEKADFVEWLKLGEADAREAKGLPKTLVAYSEQFGISRKTLHAWKRDPDVKRAVLDHGVSIFTVDELKRARDKLLNRGLEDGNVQALLRILEIGGVIGKNAAAQAAALDESPDFSKLSDDELDQLDEES